MLGEELARFKVRKVYDADGKVRAVAGLAFNAVERSLTVSGGSIRLVSCGRRLAGASLFVDRAVAERAQP